MLHKIVAIGLFALLLCHTMVCVIVAVVDWWQAEHDLFERLVIYRSVDSIVECPIPLRNTTDGANVVRTTSPAFWHDDLLTFLNDHLIPSSDSGREANQLLKFLLKEYFPGSPIALDFICHSWGILTWIPDVLNSFASRVVSVHSPPPEPVI